METPFCKKTIGFIGAGNMAEAMIHALVYQCRHSSARILASDPSREKRERMTSLFQIFSTENNTEVFQKSDILVLAVKPQQMKRVLEGLVANPQYEKNGEKKLIISIAAGIPLSFLETILKGKALSGTRKNITLVRAMPNTPSLVGEGMAGVCPEPDASAEDVSISLALMQAMGKAILVQESLMDSLTALSGSGPAYLFFFAEAMIRAGEQMGMDEKTASILTIQTLKGAVALMERGEKDVASLRKAVTSPGGTTEAAISVFMEKDLAKLVLNAMTAAQKRSKELERENGQL